MNQTRERESESRETPCGRAGVHPAVDHAHSIRTLLRLASSSLTVRVPSAARILYPIPVHKPCIPRIPPVLAAKEKAEQATWASQKAAFKRKLQALKLRRAEITSNLQSVERDAEERKRRGADIKGLWKLHSDMERMAGQVDAEVEETKQALYFPACDGFRYSTGGNGVYVGIRDFMVEKVSNYTQPGGSL